MLATPASTCVQMVFGRTTRAVVTRVFRELGAIYNARVMGCAMSIRHVSAVVYPVTWAQVGWEITAKYKLARDIFFRAPVGVSVI